MPADLSAANSDDRSKLCLTWPPARPNGAYRRGVRIYPWSSTNLASTRAVRHCAEWAAPGLDSEHRTAHFSAPRHRRKS
jgi:hypothetical protein